ncbi:hypothetical protein OEZ85_011315 [Tetradesmus obliquus]|uniref:HIG1 domain-containing protein n=1 Tax=Tetradesmus obliquus TaxID=3088 RepID=A0ABY8TPZ2_TETOB|nr:hypothetical protein OEZ85_011315 [Tetradesmus obliquus]
MVKLSESKGARVFGRVAVVTGLIVVAIHYNQHQERQNMRAGPLRDEQMYQEKLRMMQQQQQQQQQQQKQVNGAERSGRD